MLLFLLGILLILNSVTFIMLYLCAKRENQTVMEHIEEYRLNDLSDAISAEILSVWVGCFFIIVFYYVTKNCT